MSAFKDRLSEAKEARAISTYKLAKDSGLDQAYVGRLLRGERGKRMAAEHYTALARVLRVRREWLQYGDGPMDLPAPMQSGMHNRVDPRFPNRQAAAEFARESGVSEDAISSVCAEPAERDWPPLMWLDRFRMRETELRAGGVAEK
jgi:transcriptional regulator with XRE-family HTH domain